MNIDSLTIDQLKDAAMKHFETQEKTDKLQIAIAVLDRGFVYIGRIEERPDRIVIHDAHNIRAWGTTRGLGELVNGPTSKTKLDKVGKAKVPSRALITIIEVDQEKWTCI